jgi:hypothetical protein
MPSLEEIIAENTAAMRENTAALKASGGGAAPAGAGRGPGRPNKVTFDVVEAVAKELMDEKGRPAAVSLIQKHGADQLANLAEAKYPEFVAAAEVLLAAAPEPAPAAEADAEL